MKDPDREYAKKFPAVTGLSIAEVKKILEARRYGTDEFLSLSSPMIALGCDPFTADRHLHAMCSSGYLVHDSQLPIRCEIEPVKHAQGSMDAGLPHLMRLSMRPQVQTGSPHWYMTPLASQLCMQKLLKRMSRTEAEHLLGRILEEVRAINSDPEELMRVHQVQLFGSMLDVGRESYGDIDLHVIQKADPRIDAKTRADLMGGLAAEGYRLDGFIAQYSAPEKVAEMRSERRNRIRLSKLSQRVSVTQQSPEELGTPWIDVYAFDLDLGREIEGVFETWKIRARGIDPSKCAPKAEDSSVGVGISTIMVPAVVPRRQKAPAYREYMRSREFVSQTAHLFAAQPESGIPCSECGGMWCSHRTDIGVADVEEGSNEHCLLELEKSLRDNPLGHPIVEMRQCLEELCSLHDVPQVSMDNSLFGEINYICLAKSGVTLSSWPNLSRVYSGAPFSVKAGTFNVNFDMGESGSTRGFVVYMRLAHALHGLWKACAFSGGGHASVALDLSNSSLETLDLRRLSLIGKMAKALRPIIKEIEKSPPFPDEYASALLACKTEQALYRPGTFIIQAEINENTIDTEMECLVTQPKGDDYATLAFLGSGSGKDIETEAYRGELKASLAPVVTELRSLPGFSAAAVVYKHDLPYPK